MLSSSVCSFVAATFPAGEGKGYRNLISGFYITIPRFCLYERREQALALRRSRNVFAEN